MRTRSNRSFSSVRLTLSWPTTNSRPSAAKAASDLVMGGGGNVSAASSAQPPPRPLLIPSDARAAGAQPWGCQCGCAGWVGARLPLRPLLMPSEARAAQQGDMYQCWSRVRTRAQPLRARCQRLTCRGSRSTTVGRQCCVGQVWECISLCVADIALACWPLCTVGGPRAKVQ